MYHSGIVESEEEDTSEKKSKNKEMKSRKEEERGDILDPDPRAQKRKSFKSSMSSKREYEEVDGMVKVTLDQLEKDFSL
jgi:predicted negative regulator of RcsB-dependent stress response